MSALGALAENTRRNERVERGTVTVPAGTATIGFTSSQTVNLSPAYGSVGGMRQMTHFQLTMDDNGTPFSAADPVQVSGSLNANGTILTISVYRLNAGNLAASATPTKIRYQIWGNLSAGQGF